MVEQPPENYSFIPPDVQLPGKFGRKLTNYLQNKTTVSYVGTKWLDNHRPVFTVTIEANTSVHTLDPHLDR